MKQWFPLTDYDFYAYLTAGMVLIAAVDYTCFGGVLVDRSQWTVVQAVFWAAVAYVAGHLIAGPSSGVIEHAFTRGFLHSPGSIMLGFAQPRWREKVFKWLFAQREYAPFPALLQTRIRKGAADALGVTPARLTHSEEVFQVAHPISRSNADAAGRMDNFRNQYGFCRNLSFTGLVSIGLLIWHRFDMPFDQKTPMLLVMAIILTVGMYGRFLKFYSAYSNEVLRAYGKHLTTGGN